MRVDWAARRACIEGVIVYIAGGEFKWYRLTEENMWKLEERMTTDQTISLIGCYEETKSVGEPELKAMIAEDVVDAGFR